MVKVRSVPIIREELESLKKTLQFFKEQNSDPELTAFKAMLESKIFLLEWVLGE